MSARLAYAPANSEPGLDLSRQQNLPTRSSGGVILAGGARYESFGAFQQIRALHPLNARSGGVRHGVVSFGQRVLDGPKPWREWTADLSEAAHIAQEMIGRGELVDTYVSHQPFLRWRSIAQLTALGCQYVDIDFRTRATWKEREPRTVLTAILLELEREGLPLPSYALDSGRGLNLVWLFDLVPRAALSRWSAVQRRLAEVLKKFGADMRALDAARVFRVAGSINNRAEWDRRRVGMIWCQGDPANPFRYSFDALADEVLPLTRGEVASLRAERAKRKAEGKSGTSPKRVLTRADWGEALLTDLQRLRQHRCPDGALPEGQRDCWLFIAAVAVSWICPPAVLEREIQSLAREAAGWADRETASRMTSVFRRAKDSAAGRKLLFDGRKVDPRYLMRSDTVIDWLEIEPAEQRAANLRMLVDKDRRRELNTARTRKSRHRRGKASREQAQADRLALGRKALYLAASEGLNRAELAGRLGVSTGQISKAMAEARQAP